MTDNTIYISFPGAVLPGGHLIGQVVSHLKFQTPVNIDSNGSCHDKNHHINLYPDASYDASVIDTDDDIVLVHCEDLRPLIDTGNPVIYVTVDSSEADEIIRRLEKKVDLRMVLKHQKEYEYIKGSDWVEFEELTEQLINTYAEELQILNQRFIHSWTYLLPSVYDKSKVLEIKFSEIGTAEMVFKIQEFLRLTDNMYPSLYQRLVEYRSKNAVNLAETVT